MMITQKSTKNTTVTSVVVCGVNVLWPKTSCDVQILQWRIKKYWVNAELH